MGNNKTEALREKIAKILCDDIDIGSTYGYWKELEDWEKEEYLEEADQILNACKEAGLEFADKDAELPKTKFPYSKNYSLGWKLGQEKMYELGWHKTEEIELDGKL